MTTNKKSVPAVAKRLFAEYKEASHRKFVAETPADRIKAHCLMMAILDQADASGYKVALALETLIEENLK